MPLLGNLGLLDCSITQYYYFYNKIVFKFDNFVFLIYDNFFVITPLIDSICQIHF
jgi:hypothetical protein